VASDAALATLDHIWSVLEPLGHPLAVMGGMSLAAWNYVRATRDVDLLISVDRSRIDPILNALGAHGCRPKKSPPILSVGQHSLVQLLYTPPGEFYDVQFDLFWRRVSCRDRPFQGEWSAKSRASVGRLRY
jgi:hypothetical protein